MVTPRKIDDRLKDAIVNIQFVSGVPNDTFIGYFHSLCREYLIDNHNFFNQFNIATNAFTVEANNSFFVAKNEKIRIDVNYQSITFNLLQGYKNIYDNQDGWKGYLPLITQILTPIYKSGIIKQTQRIGVRYISQFENVSIYDCTNLKVDLGIETGLPRRGQLRAEFEENGFWNIITLLNSYPLQMPAVASLFSLIDIDVIKNFNNTISFEDLISNLSNAHDIEKKLFFSILNSSFLTSLNPVY